MTEFARTKLNTVRRAAERGHYDKVTVYAIVDEARICHVGIVEDGRAIVIPQLHVRVGDEILLHGSHSSRLMKTIASGEPICITCTLLDGLVLARSAFHHSMNYRSAVIFGTGRGVEDSAEKADVFRALTEKIVPGRSGATRLPNEKEIRATALVAVSIDSASAKIRTGPPKDMESDLHLPHWAGVIPIRECTGETIADPALSEGIQTPEHVKDYQREHSAPF